MEITAFIGFLDPKNPRIAARITSVPQVLREIGYLMDLAAILDAILDAIMNISISPRVPPRWILNLDPPESQNPLRTIMHQILHYFAPNWHLATQLFLFLENKHC
jgi:hypothetical protein